MKKLLIAGVLATALVFTVSASAALVPGVYDPGNTGCAKATFIKKTKTLHLEKNCPTATNASAGAEVTGVSGQTFQSASFTLASATQCQGGSPRFNVETTTGFFFLGCNNVTPTTNPDGTVTYTFTAATLAAAGQQSRIECVGARAQRPARGVARGRVVQGQGRAQRRRSPPPASRFRRRPARSSP